MEAMVKLELNHNDDSGTLMIVLFFLFVKSADLCGVCRQKRPGRHCNPKSNIYVCTYIYIKQRFYSEITDALYSI